MSSKQTETALAIFAPEEHRLEATRKKIESAVRHSTLALEDFASAGEDFALYREEHEKAYGQRPPQGLGFGEWVAKTYGVTEQTMRNWIRLHENRPAWIGQASSLRGALELIRHGGDSTSSGQVFGKQDLGKNVVVTARQQKAEKAKAEELSVALGVDYKKAHRYVVSKRKPPRAKKKAPLPEGWKATQVPLTTEAREELKELVEKARTAGYDVLELYTELFGTGLDKLRKKYRL